MLPMRKMFDVATERLEPCTQEQDWAARYIGCAVKDMVSHETGASGMMIGAFLAGLDVVASKYKVTDTRNMKGDERGAVGVRVAAGHAGRTLNVTPPWRTSAPGTSLPSPSRTTRAVTSWTVVICRAGGPSIGCSSQT